MASIQRSSLWNPRYIVVEIPVMDCPRCGLIMNHHQVIKGDHKGRIIMSCVQNCHGGYAWDIITKLLNKINTKSGQIRDEQKNKILKDIQNTEKEIKILTDKLVALRLQAKDMHIDDDEKANDK